jgi:hypothetical protein
MAEETPPRAGTTGACSSFNHLVGAQQERLRNGQAECLGGREIDDEIEFGGCSTGRSPGLAPRRILSTYSAARRNVFPRG